MKGSDIFQRFAFQVEKPILCLQQRSFCTVKSSSSALSAPFPKDYANSRFHLYFAPCILNLQTLFISLRLLMVILLMPHRQPLLHELFAALGVDADAHWIAGRRGVVAEDLPHLVKQADG